MSAKFSTFMRLSAFHILAGVFWAGCTAVGFQTQLMRFVTVPTPTLPTTLTRQLVESLPEPTPTIAPTATASLTSTPAPVLTATLPPTPTKYVYSYGPNKFPPDINPLTGLPVGNPNLLERRPVVIKVTNFPRSVRPQWGLSRADHVYEYYIGDQMSRFIGVFYGQDASRVGPIRSARLFDEHVMRMYKGIFVFGWADDPVLEFFLVDDVKNLLVVERPDNCPPLCRFGPEYAYNTLFTDTSQIQAYLEARRTNNERQDLSGLLFRMDTPPSGNPGTQLSLAYSHISYHYWEYHPESGRYLRYQEKKDNLDNQPAYAPLMDSLTGEQLAADNLVVLQLPHEYYYQSSSTEIIDQLINGEGQGYALRDGQIYPLTWEQETPQVLLTLKLPTGQLYPLKPGNVWFEIISETSELAREEDGGWRFTFRFP